MTSISFVMMTWARPTTTLVNSLWTLTHQTVLPNEIIVVEASPTQDYHDATRELCEEYPLVKLIETGWPNFNISRGINVGIRATHPAMDYVAAVGMELLFSENFVETTLKHIQPNFLLRAACGSLWEDAPTYMGPKYVRDNWDVYCHLARPYPPPLAPGAMMCARRKWWFDIHGYDEIRRPYSYPDVDIQDRAVRSGMQVADFGRITSDEYPLYNNDAGIFWDEAQCLHPYHPQSVLFYSVSGWPVDMKIDASIERNGPNWGEP